MLHQEETDRDTVKEIRADGDIVVEIKVSGVKASLGSQTIQSKAGDSVITQTLTFSGIGLLLERKSDSQGDKANSRFEFVERLIYPGHPVSVGNTWSYKEPSSPVKGTFDNETLYTFLGSERVDGDLAKKISVDYKETGTTQPMSSTGFIWVSAIDGSIVKKDIQVSNLNAPGGTHAFKLRIQVDRLAESHINRKL
jgi:hypothetical protein